MWDNAEWTYAKVHRTDGQPLHRIGMDRLPYMTWLSGISFPSCPIARGTMSTAVTGVTARLRGLLNHQLQFASAAAWPS